MLMPIRLGKNNEVKDYISEVGCDASSDLESECFETRRGLVFDNGLKTERDLIFSEQKEEYNSQVLNSSRWNAT